MTRYIIIEQNTGYIWGDSADYAANAQSDLTPTEAARLLDESIGDAGHAYSECNRYDAGATYHVYRADIKGSDAVAVIQDGQDQEMIEAVERDCEFVTAIKRASRELFA